MECVDGVCGRECESLSKLPKQEGHTHTAHKHVTAHALGLPHCHIRDRHNQPLHMKGNLI